MPEDRKENLNDTEVRKDDEIYYSMWGHLIAKHSIRWEIWVILELFYELNINQISQYLKQTRFTVSKHLKAMEDDKMLISREIQPEKRGKYAPKYYRINPVSRKALFVPDEDLIPKDNEKRIRYYKALINEHRVGVENYKKILDYTHDLVDFFEDNLKKVNKDDEESIERIDKIFNSYFVGKNEPLFIGMAIDEKRSDEVLKLYEDFCVKLHEIEKRQFKDPFTKGHSFRLLTIKLPIKLIFELKRKILLDKSKSNA